MNTTNNNLQQEKLSPEPVNISEGKAFAIANWTESFENAQTRRTKHLNSVLMPIRDQSSVQKRILTFENGYKALAIWHLIIQMAAECPQRGLLIRGTGALDFDDMSLDLGIPEADIREAFAILCHEKVQLIETVMCPQNLLISGSLRKGRKTVVFPHAVDVKNNQTGPNFLVDCYMQASTEFSENGVTFKAKRVYSKNFEDLFNLSGGHKSLKAAQTKDQRVLEHETNTNEPGKCSDMENIFKSVMDAKKNKHRRAEGS